MTAGEPYLVVSTDAHAGPAPEQHLRSYCPEKHLDAFDEFCRQARHNANQKIPWIDEHRAGDMPNPTLGDLGREACMRCVECEGHHDPHVRLGHMDDEGIAAEVIFAGGQNFEQLPFLGKGWTAGNTEYDEELRAVAIQIWNRWIADYISVDTARLVGVLQIPIWDVEAAVREVRWGVERGARVVNLPAPRLDFPSYANPMYEPLWSVCEEAGVALVTHSGGGEDPLGANDFRGDFIMIAEHQWLSSRGLTQLTFGGVFHRHPQLKLVLTEQRVEFAPYFLRHLDSVYEGGMRVDRVAPAGGIVAWAPLEYGPNQIASDPSDPNALPKRPSEYWASNCYLSGSFLAPFEVAMRHEVGVGNLMWGSDYPHQEGTWPYSRQAIRNTFWDVPEAEARLILGETAIDVYGLDRDALAPVARRIGMTTDEVATPLEPEEYPMGRGGAFREWGACA
ncbi:MAG: amidohydrolase 2 [Actinomycetia bacterium]|nr:amidohydrolase 2 [Actinomycetes bacterium]